MSKFPLTRIAADADGLHLAGPDLHWREAWYFEFLDPKAGLQFQAYQGVFPNQLQGDVNAAFFHRGRLVHQLAKMDYTLAPEPLEERLNFGPMKLEMLAPFERWRIRYDCSEIAADLYFEALHAPYSWGESSLPMETTSEASQRSQHFDQFGRYTGSVWINGEEIAVDTLGFRDRMWGWGARQHWESYIVLWAGFAEDFVANVSLQRFTDGSLGLVGYIHRDGQRSLLRHARVELEWDEHRWRTLKRVNARLTDQLGRSLSLSGVPGGFSDTSHRWKHRHDHMMFSVGTYQCGERTGHGVINWAFRTERCRPDILESGKKSGWEASSALRGEA
jgi:hypothetical protein